MTLVRHPIQPEVPWLLVLWRRVRPVRICMQPSLSRL